MMKKILVTGSIAYDVVMDCVGSFSDLILPEKIQELNLCLFAPHLEKHDGGVAQNVAYSLGLLGLRDATMMVGAVGKDFVVNPRLERFIDYAQVYRDQELFTAGAYMMNDAQKHQIIAFHPGAMASASAIDIERLLDQYEVGYALVGPNDAKAMFITLSECHRKQVPVFFDPGQQLSLFSVGELKSALSYATYLICNDYEYALLQQKTGFGQEDLLGDLEKIIVTLGKDGVRLIDKTGTIDIPGLLVEHPADPTGAGDSFRSGLLAGLSWGRSWEDAARLGNTVAYHVVQSMGSMNHVFEKEEILSQCIK